MSNPVLTKNMARQLTRRQTIKATASTLAVAGGASSASADDDPPTGAVIDEGHSADYPRYGYQRTNDGEWAVAEPINIHARVPGERAALSVVTDSFTGVSNIDWTRVFPDLPTKAWDQDEQALVTPDYSFRRPQMGDKWVHVHIWEVDEDRIAIHAHRDVIALTASHFHGSDHYDKAARTVTDQFLTHGWQEQTPYTINYDLDDEHRDQWGETGDVKVMWTRSS